MVKIFLSVLLLTGLLRRPSVAVNGSLTVGELMLLRGRNPSYLLISRTKSSSATTAVVLVDPVFILAYILHHIFVRFNPIKQMDGRNYPVFRFPFFSSRGEANLADHAFEPDRFVSCRRAMQRWLTRKYINYLIHIHNVYESARFFFIVY
jgi:hypothetical protein